MIEVINNYCVYSPVGLCDVIVSRCCFCFQTIVRGNSQTGLQNGTPQSDMQRINVARSNSLRQQSPQSYRGNNFTPAGVPPTVREYEPQGPPRPQPPQGYGQYPPYGHPQQGPPPEFYNSMSREKQPPGADYRDYRDGREPREGRHPREMMPRQYPQGYPGEYPSKEGPPDYGRMRDDGSLQRPREREMRPQQMPRSPSATIPTGGNYQNYGPAVVNGGMAGTPTSSLPRKPDYDDHGGFQPQVPAAAQQYDRVSAHKRGENCFRFYGSPKMFLVIVNVFWQVFGCLS